LTAPDASALRNRVFIKSLGEDGGFSEKTRFLTAPLFRSPSLPTRVSGKMQKTFPALLTVVYYACSIKVGKARDSQKPVFSVPLLNLEN
jgi:hypothetical protein